MAYLLPNPILIHDSSLQFKLHPQKSRQFNQKFKMQLLNYSIKINKDQLIKKPTLSEIPFQERKQFQRNNSISIRFAIISNLNLE